MIYNDERPEMIRGRIWLTALCLFVIYGALSLFVPNSDLILASHVLRAAACAMVVAVYWGDAWRALKTAVPERTDYLIVGIVFSFLSNTLQSIQGVVGRLAGLPAWWLQNGMIGPTLLLSVIAAVLHVSAPGAVDGVVPRKNRIVMGVFFGVAVLVLGCILATQPDIGPALERVRPYISGDKPTLPLDAG